MCLRNIRKTTGTPDKPTAAGAPGFAVLIRFTNEGGLARGSFPPYSPVIKATGEWRAEGSSLDFAVNFIIAEHLQCS